MKVTGKIFSVLKEKKKEAGEALFAKKYDVYIFSKVNSKKKNKRLQNV